MTMQPTAGRRWKRFFVPAFELRLLPRMLAIAALGAAVAGLYGILHDQITYSISGEYFTKLKFHQFHHANFGFPTRVLVAEIGCLATWWVGFIAGWFLARIAVPAWPFRIALRRSMAGCLIIISAAMLAGGTGYILALNHSPDYSHWSGVCGLLDVRDVPHFVQVAYVHNAGYLGGLLGLIAAIANIFRLRKGVGRRLREA